jgi:hypothetical protein
MKHLRFSSIILALALAWGLGCGDPDPDDVREVTYNVELAGDNQLPAVATPATGDMEVQLTDRLLTIEGSFDGLVSRLRPIDGSSIHIHVGDMDENGPVVFPVSVSADDDERSGTFSLTETLTADQVRLFDDGMYYLNIHTNAYPQGELRGQLDEDAPEFARVSESWGVELSTDAQPHVVTSDAEGWLWAILRTDDTFIVSGAVQDLEGDLNDVVIGRATDIATGPTVFTLQTEERINGVYRFFLDRNLTDTQVDDLEDGLYYLNVLTDEFPQGELRGNLDEADGFFTNIWETIFGDDPDTIEEAPPF